MITVAVQGRVIQKFAQYPENLRAKLRAGIPDITRMVGDRVRAKLAPGVLFKTTNRLLPAVSTEMHESADEIYGRVYIDPDIFPAIVALSLESGARAHQIVARNAKALAFMGPQGTMIFRRSVNHPGFAGRSYMQSTLNESKDEITEKLSAIVTDAFKES